ALPFLLTGVPLGRQLLGEWRGEGGGPPQGGAAPRPQGIDQSPPPPPPPPLAAAPALPGPARDLGGLAPPALATVSRAAPRALLLAYVLVWVLAPARRAPLALLLDLALACCAMLQVVGFNLKAQFVVLLLPAWLGGTLAWRPGGRAPRALLVAAGALFLLAQP